MECPTLPVTGSSSVVLAIVAFTVIAVGAVLVARSRRSSVTLAAVLGIAALGFALVSAPRVSAAADCAGQSPVTTSVPGNTVATSTTDLGNEAPTTTAGATTTTTIDETTTTVEDTTTTVDETTTTELVECGPSSVFDGESCVCLDGYEMRDGLCLPAELLCGVNEIADQGECVCREGYVRYEGRCIRASLVPGDGTTTTTTTDPVVSSGGSGGSAGDGDACTKDCG